jgi:hypothetical protein
MSESEYNGYKIVGDGTYGYKEIKPAGRGSIHLSLRGKFTTEKVARQAIDQHLSSKVSKDDKAD